MGYAWNGACYQDTASALAAFAEQVPSATASGINSFTTVPTIGAAGLITWSISNRPLTTTAATTRTGTTQLQVCATEGLDQWPVQSIVFYLALMFAVFAGFKTGFRP
jgi:hypothetical protein